MESYRSLLQFVLRFSTITDLASAQAVAEETVGGLAMVLPTARIAVWLSGPSTGSVIGHAAAGQMIPGKAEWALTRQLAVRGVLYGHLQVEFLQLEGEKAEWKELLEVLAMQLALFAERYRMFQRRAALRRQLAQARELLATEKIVTRASGVVAKQRGIGAADARRLLQSEAARKGRSLQALAAAAIAEAGGTVSPAYPIGLRHPDEGEFAA